MNRYLHLQARIRRREAVEEMKRYAEQNSYNAEQDEEEEFGFKKVFFYNIPNFYD